MSPFLPETLAGWVALVVELFAVLLAALGIAWRLVKIPLEQQINGLGERVRHCESAAARHDEAIHRNTTSLRDAEHDRNSMHDRVGRIEGSVERLIIALERNRDAHMEETGEIRERLVRIETKLDDIKHTDHR